MCLTSTKFVSNMARRNLESKLVCDNTRTNKTRLNASKLRKSPVQEPKAFKDGNRSPDNDQFQRTAVPLSPTRAHSYSPVRKSASPSENITKQYAGCKWTEPPSPSTLPHPPQHWMQTSTQPFFARPFQKICLPEQDIAQQLKVLLKVQA